MQSTVETERRSSPGEDSSAAHQHGPSIVTTSPTPLVVMPQQARSSSSVDASLSAAGLMAFRPHDTNTLHSPSTGSQSPVTALLTPQSTGRALSSVDLSSITNPFLRRQISRETTGWSTTPGHVLPAHESGSLTVVGETNQHQPGNSMLTMSPSAALVSSSPQRIPLVETHGDGTGTNPFKNGREAHAKASQINRLQPPQAIPNPPLSANVIPNSSPNRIQAGVDAGSARAVSCSPRPVNNQESTFTIRKICWAERDGVEPRISPVLSQNINGPCPLLAITNCLVLTVPRNAQSDLVDALKDRDQITCETLVTNIVSELYAEYRMHNVAADANPTEISEFLIGLSKGMDVDPRFFATEQDAAAWKQQSRSPSPSAIPGTFEKSRELALFGQFGIPLVHGWVPDPESHAIRAMRRHAPSYEAACMLMSQIDEFESKLDQGLSNDEQQRYLDALVLRDFIFKEATTHLTEHGINVIRESMPLGKFAILFRNEHFSTLYCHPNSQQIFALVTDAGLATHEEVVWESLVDVTGQNTGYYSGDFRPVGGVDEAPSNPDASTRTVEQAASDADFAMALQLQEEEDRRARGRATHRTVTTTPAANVSIQQLNPRSQHPLSGSSHGPSRRGARGSSRGACNVRGGGLPGAFPPLPRPPRLQIQPTRQPGFSSNPPLSMLSPVTAPAASAAAAYPATAAATMRSETADGETPPPSYEEAARTTPFAPPQGHPAHPDATVQNAAQNHDPEATRINAQAVHPLARQSNAAPPRVRDECKIM